MRWLAVLWSGLLMLVRMHPVFALGFGLYIANFCVGLAAQLRLGHFGIWHHMLYLSVFISGVAALIFAREPLLLITIVCLALFPKARPRTWLHPTLGVLGLVGYLLAWKA